MDKKSFIMSLDSSLFSDSDTGDETIETENPDAYAKAPISQEQITTAQAQVMIGNKNILPGAKYFLICTEYNMCVSRISADGQIEEFQLEETRESSYHDHLTPMSVRSEIFDTASKPTSVHKDRTMQTIALIFVALLVIGIGLLAVLSTM